MMAADYRHIGGVENRLGRHYSRFSPFWPAASFADQSLALRKSWNAGSNRRSQASADPQPSFPVPSPLQKTSLLLSLSQPGGRKRRATAAILRASAPFTYRGDPRRGGISGRLPSMNA